ncbi:MAG: RNA-binding S4 domain-containing protein [Bacteroidales bacterium]
MSDQIRIDKWLWAVRIFKTRSKATHACRNGKVKMHGQQVKPSAEIKPGDIIQVSKEQIDLEIKVLKTLEKRVGAKVVPEYMEDLTPEENYKKREIARHTNFEYREKGHGRPTKKERREIERLKKFLK